MRHDLEKRRECNGKRKGSRSSFPRRSSLAKHSPKGASLSGQEIQQMCCSFMRGVCPQDNACDYWHHLSAPFITKGGCKLGNLCAFNHTEKAGGEPKRRNYFVAVTQTLGVTQEGKEITSLNKIAKRDPLHFVSAVPMKFNLQQVGETIVEKLRTF